MEQNRLYGIGEPVWVREIQDGIPAETTLDIIHAIGFSSWREWMHIPSILENPTTPKQEVVKRFTEILDKAAALDIEVTGMSHSWFLPEGCMDKSGDSMPRRDLTPGSLYMQTLEMLEQSWYTLVSCFPQVPMWEVGNEWNIDPFLHPDGYYQNDRKERFTLSEKADIAVDMMYFSAKGIRRANPKAKVVSVSPCPCDDELPHYLPVQYGIAKFFDMIYQRIHQEGSWSQNNDDYFDLLAWHPYIFTQTCPTDVWADSNDAVYRVMEKYGDGHKKALLTEFGFTDQGDPEKEKDQANSYRRVFEYCAQRPYIYTLHLFRLFEDFRADTTRKTVDWGGVWEVYFGIFKEPENGLTPRTKALEMQKLTGSTADLWQFRTDLHHSNA